MSRDKAIIKTEEEIGIMREAGRITAMALDLCEKLIEPGVSTKKIDEKVERFIVSKGAVPAFKGYRVGNLQFPGSLCSSINDEVVHGIPSFKRKLKDGDIISIDIGVKYKGWHGDAARTFKVGKVSNTAEKLIQVCRNSLEIAIENARPGIKLKELGEKIQNYVESQGFGVVRDFVGHGIGKSLHEDPQIPNYYISSANFKLVPGLCIAIEPMVTEGGFDVIKGNDGWVVKTKDRKLSAHFENTIAITEKGCMVLTAV